MEGKAADFLSRVGLGARLSHRPGELSGGECQRVAVVRALIMSPELVLADEPSGNLDSRASEQLHDIITELAQSGRSDVPGHDTRPGPGGQVRDRKRIPRRRDDAPELMTQETPQSTCESCGEREATILFTRIHADEKETLRLCAVCAAREADDPGHQAAGTRAIRLRKLSAARNQLPPTTRPSPSSQRRRKSHPLAIRRRRLSK